MATRKIWKNVFSKTTPESYGEVLKPFLAIAKIEGGSPNQNKKVKNKVHLVFIHSKLS